MPEVALSFVDTGFDDILIMENEKQYGIFTSTARGDLRILTPNGVVTAQEAEFTDPFFLGLKWHLFPLQIDPALMEILLIEFRIIQESKTKESKIEVTKIIDRDRLKLWSKVINIMIAEKSEYQGEKVRVGFYYSGPGSVARYKRVYAQPVSWQTALTDMFLGGGETKACEFEFINGQVINIGGGGLIIPITGYEKIEE